MSSNQLHLVSPSTIQVQIDTFSAVETNYSITAVSPLNITNNELVTVQFNSSSPSSSDWIGAYSPPGVDVTVTAPVKYGYCGAGSSSSYLTTGVGQLSFNLTNLRDGVQFHYFSGGLHTPVLQDVSSQIVTFKNNNQPLRNRIVPSGDPNIYTLLWSSATSTTPILRWGLQNSSYVYFVNATTTTIAKNSLCGGAATTVGWRDLGLIHSANFTGIVDLGLSNLELYYSFGDAATNDFSEEFSFHLPPLAGTQPPNRPTQVALYADMGVGTNDDSYGTTVWEEACPPAVNTSNSLGYRVLRGDFDVVFHSGDISYANGYLSNWDFFLDQISPIAGRVAYLTTVGNHESDWPDTASNPGYGTASGGECSVVALAMIPQPPPAITNKPWWSYDVGLIHFVGMSTEHNFTFNSEQYLWIEQDLQNVNRSITPWVIMSGHRPMYVDSNYCCPGGTTETCTSGCTAGEDVEVMQALQANIEPLLHKYRVNLGWAGHFHNVQRQAAVYQGNVAQYSSLRYDAEGNPVHWHDNPNATVWMVIGSGGHDSSFSNQNYTWSERYWNLMWGYAVVTAVNATYLQWNFINSANDGVIDRMVITQNFDAWDTSDDILTSSSSSSSSSGWADLSTSAQIGIVFACAAIGILIIVVSGFVFQLGDSM